MYFKRAKKNKINVKILDEFDVISVVIKNKEKKGGKKRKTNF